MTLGHPCLAHISAVQDHPVMGIAGVLSRYSCLERVFDGQRRFGLS